MSSFLIAVTAILAMFFMGEARASEVSAEITRTYLYAGTLSEGVGALKARAMRLIALSQVLPYLAAYRTLKPDLDFGFARRPSRPVAYQSLSFCDASHV